MFFLLLSLVLTDASLDALAAWAWTAANVSLALAEASLDAMAAWEWATANEKPAAHGKPLLGKSVAQPVQQATQAPLAPYHSHRCSSCGTIWSHTDASYGDRAAHSCPQCGKVQWQIYQRNVGREVIPSPGPQQPQGRTQAPRSASLCPT
jgi:predicted RNA-binding Zn-ribbon protein involved in translation (DUF1610 family)